jgi:hypothetical protein
MAIREPGESGIGVHPSALRSSAASRNSRLRRILGGCLLAVPVLALAIVSVRTSVNIPLEDDYGISGIGEFLQQWVTAPTSVDKLKWFVAASHVQYKLFYMHAVELLQYWCTGTLNYRTLQLIGDCALLVVPLVLWFLLARSGRPLSQRLWLFVFPCFLFLSPRYVQTINWALSGLQNISVIPFAIASIFFVTATWSGAFAWSMVFLVVAIATSGNGFFVAFGLLYFLLRSRRFLKAGVTVAVVLLMAVFYAYHFQPYNPPFGPLPLPIALARKIIFPVTFLGGACGFRDPAIMLGLVLLIGFAVLTWKGWERACPGSFGAALFCLVTTAGATATRSGGGVPGSMQERYMMYGMLLLCLEYLAVLRLYAPQNFGTRSRWTAAIAALSLAAIVFCAVWDVLAYRELETRKKILTTHLILWERHPDRLVLVPDEGFAEQQPDWVWLRVRFQQDLQREIASGLYVPPYSASDPLPIRTHSPSSREIENEGP